MDAGAWMMAVVVLLTVGALVFLIFSTVRNITAQRTPGRSVWREFGLGLVLMILFFTTWIGQGISEWQTYTDEQAAHGETTGIGDFISEFAQSTLENWQSEFLQLFAFVTLAALYIHKGSAESKDSDEKMEASLRRIEEHLGTLPANAPRESDQRWQLPETPLELQD
jgi:phosphotransferase system  glucose/maltose/N-acetylglucosamine-specific IIC component